MKKIYLLFLLPGLFFSGYSQRAVVPKEIRDKAVKSENHALESTMNSGSIFPGMKPGMFPPEETIVGQTRYDDQSNASCQNRLYLYDDGSMGVTFTLANNDGVWTDRGSGYNYFDGNSWGDMPSARIESVRTGWPSYAPWGENGEIVVAHGSAARVASTRTEKGTGSWTFSDWPGPPGHEYVIWNRTITSGIDHMRVHSMAVTASTVYSGTPYEGLNGALVYSLSLDGGASWELQNVVLDGMTSESFTGFDGDTYNFAEPKGDIIAFTVGDSWYDFILMKSTDGGQTFEKTVIWQHPYPLFDPQAPFATDTFYTVDGSHHSVIDNNGMVHVVFGINRAYSDGTGTFWFPGVDGVGYWNESMPTFSDDLNALCPYSDCSYSELVEDYNLIGWTQDVNNNGTIDVLADWGTYYLGFSSMVQVVLGNNNELYIVFSSVTETFNNNLLNYRHLWARTSPDGGLSWGDFFDLTSALAHLFDECVYPSCAANTDDNLYLVYQTDNEPGVNIWGTGHPVTDNFITVMSVNKDEITGIRKMPTILRDHDVSQNYPNPFDQTTQINVNLRQPAVLDLEVVNMVGQVVYRTRQHAQPGINKFTLDAGNWRGGIYFYTVRAGDHAVTKKMVVE